MFYFTIQRTNWSEKATDFTLHEIMTTTFKHIPFLQQKFRNVLNQHTSLKFILCVVYTT